MKIRIHAVLVLSALFPAGCGTIMNGTYQKVGVASTPSGARVHVDGADVGSTPVIVELKRKDDHRIRVTLDGYEPYEIPITCKVSGWVWGNIIFGGPIGLGVDALSGGMYKLTPEDIHAHLATSGTGAVFGEGEIYIGVVLNPNPSWEKIGQLERSR